MAQGEYIAFLDSDDEWMPEKSGKQVKAFEKSDSRVGVIYTRSIAVGQSGEAVTGDEAPKHRGYIFRKLLISNRIRGGGSNVMVRRECFEKVGGSDGALPSCQDWDMWIRLSKHYEFDFVPQELVKYFDHSE